MIGYRFVTERGRSYEIVDLGANIIEVPFACGRVPSTTCLARPGVEAHFRISFAKNKTDGEFYFALGAQNLLGVLPLRDKTYHYRHRFQPGDIGVVLLRQTPVHFSLIDAFVSNHGPAGSWVPRPLETRTLIASDDLLLADWSAARRLGLDPYASQINAALLREIGLPTEYEIEGSLAVYPGWKNAHPLLVDSSSRRNAWVGLHRAIEPWMQSVNPELFPFKDAIDGRLNRLLSGLLAHIDAHPAAFWGTVGLNYGLAATHRSLEALQTLFAKDSLAWREAPLDLDLAAYQPSDYEAVVDYLEPLVELVRRTEVDRNGLRWRYLDGSVLFEFSRVIPALYDDFAARVDISKSIQFMSDYIGGTAVPVAHDPEGRITHQAERNLYLPQPNYLVLYDGKVIDVTKIECIRYQPDRRTIYWKTVASENDSASYDDGIVSFERTGHDNARHRGRTPAVHAAALLAGGEPGPEPGRQGLPRRACLHHILQPDARQLRGALRRARRAHRSSLEPSGGRARLRFRPTDEGGAGRQDPRGPRGRPRTLHQGRREAAPGPSARPASASFIDEDGFAHFLGQAGVGRDRRRAEPVNGDPPAMTIFGRAKDEGPRPPVGSRRSVAEGLGAGTGGRLASDRGTPSG